MAKGSIARVSAICFPSRRAAPPRRRHRSLHVRVGATLGPALDDTHETAVVHETLLGPASQDFLLVLLRDLGCLVLHLSGPRQAAVHFAHGYLRILRDRATAKTCSTNRLSQNSL